MRRLIAVVGVCALLGLAGCAEGDAGTKQNSRGSERESMFTSVAEVERGALAHSNTVMLKGLDSSGSSATVSGGLLLVNGEVVASGTTVHNGYTVAVAVQASEEYETETIAEYDIAGEDGVFSVTTCVCAFEADAISAGAHHSFALRAGELWVTGWNRKGQLGLGDTDNRYAFEQVGSGSDWIEVDGGAQHTVGLRDDGSVWEWGVPNTGSGNWYHDPYLTPQLLDDSTIWSEVTAGGGYLVLRSAINTLHLEGENLYGQLGLGETGFFGSGMVAMSGWAKIAAGHRHTLGIRSNNKLWAWGANSEGQLGQGNKTQRDEPVQVGSANWNEISAGQNFSVAIRSDGTLWSWGNDSYDNLGVGGTEPDSSGHHRLSPVQVGSDDDWAAIAAGGYHVLALKDDGSLWSWGMAGDEHSEIHFGQVGNGTFYGSAVPEQIGEDTDWVEIAAGNAHSLARKADNSVWSWGWAERGQTGLGDGAEIEPECDTDYSPCVLTPQRVREPGS